MNLQNCAGYRRQLLLDFLQVEAVRLRIEQVAEETGYAPPESFRGRRKTSPLIIVILPDFGQCVLQDMMEHLRRDAMQLGKQLLIVPANREKPQDMILLIASCEPMGVILMQETVTYPLAEALSHRNLPVVVCGGLSDGQRFLHSMMIWLRVR